MRCKHGYVEGPAYGEGSADLRRLGTAMVAAQALATAMLCQPARRLRLEAKASLDLPSEVAAALEGWATEPRLRIRRAFAIPVFSLSCITARGGLDPYTSTEAEIMDRGRLEQALAESPFWAAQLSRAQSTDGASEEFYDAHFPDDIPDEWSTADRHKSHGFGLNACSQERFVKRWFGDLPCAAVWKGQDVRGGAGFSFAQNPVEFPPFTPVRKVICIPLPCQ